MTRSHDGGGGPNGDSAEHAAAQSAEQEQDDALPLLPLLDAEAGPARPLSERELLLWCDRVERQFAQRARSVARRSRRPLVLVGSLFAASAAAAVYGVGVLRREAAEVAPPSVSSGRAEGGAQAEPTRSGVLPSVSPRPVSAPVPATELAPAAPPSVPAPDSDTAARSQEERPAAPSISAPKSVPPGPAASKPSRSVVADRLAAANAQRARHRYREALALYLQVIEIDPNGMQASVARVAAAEMRLEQFGDVAGAERLYREARTQGGELTVEAQFGLAQVARARGDALGERRALQDFLVRHPQSPLVSAARRRLHSLGAE